MAMSTRTLAEAARLLTEPLIDSLQIMDVGAPVTVGHEVTRELTEVGQPVRGLVQTVSLESAVEGRVTQAISIKVPQGTDLVPGQAVKVLFCRLEPDLSQQVFLVDTMSLNGLALIRKGTAVRFEAVNQEGKGGLA